MAQPPPNWIAPGGNDFSTSGPGIIYQGALYMPGMDYITGNLAVARTTDLGNDGAQVWTEVLGPAVGPFWHIVNEAATIGTKFYFTYQDPISGDQCLVIFDVTTQSFGTPVTGGPALGLNGSSSSDFIKVTFNPGTSTWTLFYIAASVSLNLYAYTYNGTWTGPILIGTPTLASFGLNGEAVTDSSGIAAVPCVDSSGGLTGQFKQCWATLSGIAVLFSGTFPVDLNFINYVSGWYSPTAAGFYYGYATHTPANISPPAPQQVNLFFVPQAAPASWSWIGVGPLASPTQDFALSSAVTMSNGLAILVVGSTTFAHPTTQGYFQQWNAPLASLSAWNGPNLFWNWSGSWTPAPPFNNPNFEGLTYTNVRITVSGVLGLAVGFGFDDSDALWLTGPAPAGTTTPTGPTPPSGGSGGNPGGPGGGGMPGGGGSPSGPGAPGGPGSPGSPGPSSPPSSPFNPVSIVSSSINGFDFCIQREYRLYRRIDYQRLGCGRLPECFKTDEREWGDQDNGSYIAPPEGAVTFNPMGVIPLPAPAAGDTVVFQFKVPIGYDGIILGQFQLFTGGGFNEGSGDLIWRLGVLTPIVPRYLKDCGNMLVSLGQVNLYQTIPGGLFVRSGNTVTGTVAAPNGSGSLPAPGTPSVLMGAHGYFWPRRGVQA